MEETFRMTCSDASQLFYRVWKPDNQNIHAVVHIFHGMAEHSGRYERFASYLNGLGIAVYAQDHRGHGMSASDEELGWFAEKDGWMRVVQDGYELGLLIRNNHPSKDLFLFGHSMGSFLVRTLIVLHPELYRGAIISGTSTGKGLLGVIGRLIASFHCMRNGGKTPDTLMDKLSFGSFGKAFVDRKTEFDWLSRDSEEVRKYREDPLCGFVCTSRFFVDLLDGVAFANSKKQIARIPKTFPLYIISGAHDPVGDFGKGVKKVFQLYQNAKIEDLTFDLIPGARHEILNETNRDEVFMLIGRWIESHISRGSR